MSTGGNVPQQGFNVGETTTEKRRGQRGTVGKGTVGKRIRSAWKAEGGKESLKEFARRHPEGAAWLMDKNGGTPEQRKARAKRIRERKAQNYANKKARGSKSKAKSKDSKETSRSAGRD